VIAGQRFDMIFTKSVLVTIRDLAPFLGALDGLLADGGRVAFLENWRGGPLLQWARRNVVHRGRFEWEDRYHGVRDDQVPLFRSAFAAVDARRPRFLVWSILGSKRGAP